MATLFKQVKKFGDILREYDLVSQEQLEVALKLQKETGKSANQGGCQSGSYCTYVY